jgi:hypothetical protein
MLTMLTAYYSTVGRKILQYRKFDTPIFDITSINKNICVKGFVKTESLFIQRYRFLAPSEHYHRETFFLLACMLPPPPFTSRITTQQSHQRTTLKCIDSTEFWDLRRGFLASTIRDYSRFLSITCLFSRTRVSLSSFSS